MPASTIPTPAGADGAAEWQGQGQGPAPLPSFYSPRTAAANAAPDQEVQDFSLSTPPPQSQPRSRPDAETSRSQPEAQSSQPPKIPQIPLGRLAEPELPSLVSPAFTPPAPGTPTSTSAGAGAGAQRTGAGAAASESEPRGVPVDSTVDSGGCGSKRPRLLETLPHVECIVRARIPTVNGAQMFLHLYTNDVDNKEHLAIVFGEHIRSKSLDAPRPGETERDRMTRGAYTGVLFPGRTESGMSAAGTPTEAATPATPATPTAPLVRVHSECYTGETVWSARCDCGEQLDEAARLMALPANKAGGIIIYLRQEGRGIGLGEKLKAYNLQDLGSDTVEANLLLRHPADARSYGLATAMLVDLGQPAIRLLTNNPDKIRAVEGPNREVVVKERVPMVPLSWRGEGGFRSREVDGYLSTKIQKMGHLLDSGTIL
ncbi:GTP cyclohydrolase II [Sporothrix schenckii 1099-18]|uniref:GTP cyclohydrolase II n=1 Tax=Sporothrix schenckii 1099-18 TaxID=1397361 RepID=A0A0F2M620_SPOSC|nr:GTP cyclohydrolase II [Sporothrix schenckii 1099-18]KJR85143.1 GTP cyclohydrolase II [Sporothrix schenckii 1099-18]